MESLFATDNMLPIIVSGVLGAVTLIVVVWYMIGGRKRKEAEKSPEPIGEDEAPEDSTAVEERRPKKVGKQFVRKPSYSHALLAATLKGHTGQILEIDFDSRGKYLLSCSEDRTVRLWIPKTFTDKLIKSIIVKVEYDHGTHCCMSPDGKGYILTQENNQTVNIYKIAKKDDGKLTGQFTMQFPERPHSFPIIAVGLASTGKFIMTCCEEKFIVWNLKGEILASVTTHMRPNSFAAVSPCGRFVICTGFTPDVKLWSVLFNKSGDFQQVAKALELAGHRASVYHCSLSADSTKVATVSKDGSWKLWNIDVGIHKTEEPKLLLSHDLPMKGQSLITISPDALTVAVAIQRSIYLYGCSTGALLETMADCHEVAISSMCWSPDSQLLCSSGGKVVHLWTNQVALEETLRDLKKQLESATSEAHKRRLLEKIKETESTVDPENYLQCYQEREWS